MQAQIAIETEKHLPAHAELKIPEALPHPRCQQRRGHVRRPDGHHGWRQVPHRAHHHRPHRPPHLALPPEHAHPGLLPPRVAVQQMIMYWGVIPRQAEITQGTVNGTIVKAVETAKECGFVEKGDLTVATAGDARLSVELEGKISSTNLAYVAQVR